MLSDWSPWKLYAKNNDTGNLNLFPFCALFYRKVPILCCCSLPICPRMSMSSAFFQSTPSLSASAHPPWPYRTTNPPPTDAFPSSFSAATKAGVPRICQVLLPRTKVPVVWVVSPAHTYILGTIFFLLGNGGECKKWLIDSV